MFSDLSTLGWVLIIGLAVFILVLNLGLLLGVKQKMKKGNWIEKMAEAGRVLRNPLKKENDLYQQLSDQVAKLDQGNSNEKKE